MKQVTGIGDPSGHFIMPDGSKAEMAKVGLEVIGGATWGVFVPKSTEVVGSLGSFRKELTFGGTG